MEKSYYNPELHHRHAIRLSGHDYASRDAYMITMCTFGGEPFFDVPELRVILEETWLELSLRFKKVQLDEFIITSNHVHFIIWLDAAIEKETTLGNIIGAYKSLAHVKWSRARRANNSHSYGKLWQKNYVDQVIRNDSELLQKREYILNHLTEQSSPIKSV